MIFFFNFFLTFANGEFYGEETFDDIGFFWEITDTEIYVKLKFIKNGGYVSIGFNNVSTMAFGEFVTLTNREKEFAIYEYKGSDHNTRPIPADKNYWAVDSVSPALENKDKKTEVVLKRKLKADFDYVTKPCYILWAKSPSENAYKEGKPETRENLAYHQGSRGHTDLMVLTNIPEQEKTALIVEHIQALITKTLIGNVELSSINDHGHDHDDGNADHDHNETDHHTEMDKKLIEVEDGVHENGETHEETDINHDLENDIQKNKENHNNDEIDLHEDHDQEEMTKNGENKDSATTEADHMLFENSFEDGFYGVRKFSNNFGFHWKLTEDEIFVKLVFRPGGYVSFGFNNRSTMAFAEIIVLSQVEASKLVLKEYTGTEFNGKPISKTTLDWQIVSNTDGNVIETVLRRKIRGVSDIVSNPCFILWASSSTSPDSKKGLVYHDERGHTTLLNLRDISVEESEIKNDDAHDENHDDHDDHEGMNIGEKILDKKTENGSLNLVFSFLCLIPLIF